MRHSADTAGTGQCVKIFDLQNSLRNSQSSSQRPSTEGGNSFSLVRLFMKQKSWSKEAISLSSSSTRSNEGACCSSSENHDSSDWHMNSQSDDMDGSATSPLPPISLRNHSLERNYHRHHTIDTSQNEANDANDDFLVENNNFVNQILDDSGNIKCETIGTFEEGMKETSTCSKPPVTSPIREEPEGMDISFESKSEHKLINDQLSTENKFSDSFPLNVNKSINTDLRTSPTIKIQKDSLNRNSADFSCKERCRSQSPSTPKKQSKSKELKEIIPRQRQDSGNSSSGYASTKGSTDLLLKDLPLNSSTPQRPRCV